MGFLLKEVLKTLCGRNQWSYAVFWKIGCNNSKLLIWEECYHEPFSRPSGHGIVGMSNVRNPNEEGCWFSSEFQSSHLGIQEEDRVSSLINKLSVNNLVVVAGEGIIGRAAFTNSHQWVLLSNFAKDAYPPEVYAEMHLQFSAGMQTVAVIPVLPHGVVQLGCFLPIMENIGFVHEVKSLILQLGCIPNALLFEDYSAKFSNERLDGRATSGVPVSVDSSVITSNSTPSLVNGSNYRSYSSHSLSPLSGKNNNRQERVVVAEVIPSNFDSSRHQHSVPYNVGSEFNNLAGSAPFGQSGPSDYANPCVNVSSSINISQLKTDRSHNLSSCSSLLLRGIPVHGGMNSLLRTPECSDQKILPEVSKSSSTDHNMLLTPSIPCFKVEEHVPNSLHVSGFVRDCILKDGTGKSAMNPKHEEVIAQHSSGTQISATDKFMLNFIQLRLDEIIQL